MAAFRAPPHSQRIFCIFLVGFAGCRPSALKTAPDGLEAKSSGPLIAWADRDHDFGAVIATEGRKMSHVYRLVNGAGHDVNLLNVINHKPCCGTVRARLGVLAPGEAADVEIDLVVGGRFGEVVNTTEVVTDLPEDARITLRTSAEAVPPIRVEEVSGGGRTLIIGEKEPHPVEFRVFAAGTRAEPPVDLDRVRLQATERVEWTGPREEISSDAGQEAYARRFVAVLKASGPPGERRAEVLIKRGDEVLDRVTVSWEVVEPLTAAPQVIALSRGRRDHRVVIESRDRKPFRVTRVECEDSGLTGRAVSAAPGLTQTLEVNGAPRAGSERGALAVFTDHPAQGRLEVSFVVLD